MSKRFVLAAICVVGLSSCEETKSERWAVDQALRADLFKECMASLPAGPVATTYNDWDEVVDECDDAAYWQARYCYENCPPARKGDE